MIATIDHLVYATPDLDRGVDALERLLGVRAVPGGRHAGRGTRNALVGLGPDTYLEIIGPDPTQTAYPSPRWLSVDRVTAPSLVAWAVATPRLEHVRERAAERGVVLGEIQAGQRARDDGTWLAWRFTDPRTVVADGLVPFFIDWGSTPHPAATAPPAGSVRSIRAEHPDPVEVTRALAACGITIAVSGAPVPALIATIAVPGGEVELR